MGKNQHVVPVGDKWGIKGEGNSRLTVLNQILLTKIDKIFGAVSKNV